MTYEEMTVDELLRYNYELIKFYSYRERRIAARDAILDMAEALDAEGLVVAPRKATAAMLAAGNVAPGLVRYEDAEDVWADMIEAAPLMGVE